MSPSKRSQRSGERTPEERERARLERERRRGVAVPDPIPDPAADLTPATAPPPEAPAGEAPIHAPEPEPVELPPTVETPAVEELPAEMPPGEDAPAEALDLAGLPVGTPPVEEPAVETPPVEEPRPAPEAKSVALPPKVTRRDSRVKRRVERLRERRASSQRWPRRLTSRLGALLALVVVGVVIWLLAQSLGGSSHTSPPPPRVVKVTIPEGYTRAQIAALAKRDGLKGDYLAASAHSTLLHTTRYGAPAGTATLEGFLFPATYDIYTGTPVKRLVNEQLLAFRENFTDAEIRRAHALGVTPYGLLTVASMIEREAAIEHDRPLIAAVIYNRLRQGIPLGIDATLRYGLNNDFFKPLTEAQLHSSSPYNTRLHRGLPPTPIGNPGRASIQAAAHPAHVGYLYYVTGADGCGEQVFSSSFAQFEHDAAAYREAVAKNHGRVPTCHRK